MSKQAVLEKLVAELLKVAIYCNERGPIPSVIGDKAIIAVHGFLDQTEFAIAYDGRDTHEPPEAKDWVITRRKDGAYIASTDIFWEAARLAFVLSTERELYPPMMWQDFNNIFHVGEAFEDYR